MRWARLGWLAELGAAGMADAAAIERVCPQPPIARRFEPDAAEHAALAPRCGRCSADNLSQTGGLKRGSAGGGGPLPSSCW